MTSISTLWPTLDPTVQQWLLQNPGTMMLPRTYVNMVAAGAGQVLHLDEHGEYRLSSADLLFLKQERAEGPRSVRSVRSVRSPIFRPTSTVTVSDLPGPDPHEGALDQ
jgi:hypothetical protein